MIVRFDLEGDEGSLQVYVVELEFLEGGLEGINWVCDAAHDFCCYEEFAPVNATFFDGQAELWLSLVNCN
jgi:hypothetical protein